MNMLISFSLHVAPKQSPIICHIMFCFVGCVCMYIYIYLYLNINIIDETPEMIC